MNYARRQQYRRVARAGRLALMSVPAAILGLYLLAAGFALPGAAVLFLAIVVGFRARHWLSLAGRSGIGARSEDEVQRALDPLRREGWRVRHSALWRGGGDVDSVVVAPSGVAFAIEIKTSAYDERHLRRVREQAVWLARRRRTRGALAVLCMVRASGVGCCESGVLIVSIDRLVVVLRAAANGIGRAAA
jgi:hypothetical protein